ncbi:MAG: hypothetical protein JO332_10865 [Planctomycetaceae bacterium]|nr:hypothetical protein [Planctomycetaceae bacterium]
MEPADEGVDKDDVLRQIAGAIPMEEGPLADLPPPEPIPAAAPAEPEPLPPADAEPPRPLSSRSLPKPTWWALHRHELAGLVTALVSLVWISLGIAARAWAPSLIGVSFAMGALLIGTQAVWSGD